MGQIKVRQLEDWVVSVHQDLARLAGQSLEQHLREVLRESALDSQRQFGREQMQHLAQFKEIFGTLPDSTEGIREDRNSSS
ncbi:MAG: hypothetical protein KDB27_21165 [Planctomycetales bacterium]|nr:hypothetical protein [Planctomycetales bacterium]